MWSGQQGCILLTLIDSFRSALLSKIPANLLVYLTSAGFEIQLFRRRREDVFAANEVIFSGSIACLGETSISLFQLNIMYGVQV